MGGGVQTSGLAIAGGGATPYLATCEEYNGTAFSAGGSLASATIAGGAGGVDENSVLCWGGLVSGSPVATSQEYNGTTWSLTNSLNIARHYQGGAGNVTSAFSTGGNWPPAVATTEEWGVGSPLPGTAYYTTQPVDVGNPDGRWYRIELTLRSGSTPEIEDINQNYGEDC
jgi:hypothetical protein